jgi:hypothetical protein
MLTELFRPAKMIPMQSNKSSKKTSKIAGEAITPKQEATVKAEVKPKPRVTKSSTPKSSEIAETASASHHHKAVSTPTPVVAPVIQPVAAPKARQVSREEIAKLAHSYWVARGHANGSPEEDWFRAERQLTQAAFAQAV